MEERFNMSSQIKKVVMTLLGVGVLCMVISLVVMYAGASHDAGDHGHGHAVAHEATQGHSAHGHDTHVAYSAHDVTNRLWSNVLLNTVWFSGIALCGMFFVAVFGISMSAWQVVIKRVAEAMWPFLIVGLILTLLVAFLGKDIYHWTHHGLTIEGDAHFDPILKAKEWYLNYGGWLTRLIIYFVGWIVLSKMIRNNSLKEDQEGGTKWYKSSIKINAAFVVFFAVSSSMWAWDAVMSLDPHWFSTLFGWYLFASYFTSFFAVITILVIVLKRMGYLSLVNDSHLHDLGKWMFAFSLIWTYFWFSQFMLIWYGNIPEETLWYLKRFNEMPILTGAVLFINFICPFLILMTRNAKRNQYVLLLMAGLILIGHYLDFFVIIMPDGAAHFNGISLLEIGTTLLFAGGFAMVFFKSLEKASLVPKNHPFLKESIHHEC